MFYTVAQLKRSMYVQNFYFKVFTFDYANMGKMLIDSSLEKKSFKNVKSHEHCTNNVILINDKNKLIADVFCAVKLANNLHITKGPQPSGIQDK